MDRKNKQDEIKNKIDKFLKEGLSKKDSAVLAGISEATLYRWIEEDESFDSRVEASILEYKHSLIENVNHAAVKDGRLALEVLRRRFPKDWGNNANFQTEDFKKGRDSQIIADKLQEIYEADSVSPNS